MTGHKFRRPDKERMSHKELLRRFTYENDTLRRIKGRGGNGYVKSTGYLWLRIDGKEYSLHSLVWFYHHKKWAVELNHKDRNKLNCAIWNLEENTRKENQTHALGIPCKALSGGKVVAEFASLSIAAAWAKTTSENIGACIRGFRLSNGVKERRVTAGGFEWAKA